MKGPVLHIAIVMCKAGFLHREKAYVILKEEGGSEMYLIPQPRREERGTGIYRLSWKGSIRLDGCREQALGYAALLQQEIREDLGFDWQITTVTGRSGKDGIILEIKEEDRPENYYLSVTEEGIRITGCDKAGLLYGVQTLRQMVRQCGAHLPVTEIWDGP